MPRPPREGGPGPLLAGQLTQLISFADQSAQAINGAIGFPVDRLKNRVVNGRLIPALHQLLEVASEYSEPQPRLSLVGTTQRPK